MWALFVGNIGFVEIFENRFIFFSCFADNYLEPSICHIVCESIYSRSPAVSSNWAFECISSLHPLWPVPSFYRNGYSGFAKRNYFNRLVIWWLWCWNKSASHSNSLNAQFFKITIFCYYSYTWTREHFMQFWQLCYCEFTFRISKRTGSHFRFEGLFCGLTWPSQRLQVALSGNFHSNQISQSEYHQIAILSGVYGLENEFANFFYNFYRLMPAKLEIQIECCHEVLLFLRESIIISFTLLNSCTNSIMKRVR